MNELKLTDLSLRLSGGGHPHHFTGFAPLSGAWARFRTLHFRTAHQNCGFETIHTP